MIALDSLDLLISALLVLALAGMSLWQKLHLERSLLVAVIRMSLQLTLLGWVLDSVFRLSNPVLIGALAIFMLLVAGREIHVRQKHRLTGLWGPAIGTLAIFSATFASTFIILAVYLQPAPWYHPQYALPLLGMLLGNSLNGISLGLDHMTHQAWKQRHVIETRLSLGATGMEALLDIRRDALRTGMMPIINSMAVTGLVSIPGMMTGQILAGASPTESVKYQWMIMAMIAVCVGVGAWLAVHLASHRLLDDRDRLRLERLSSKT